MKKETKSFAEYKAPRCKCVKVHVQNLVCTSPTFDVSDPFNDDDSEEGI